jgi:deoxyribose-phosphate aldolase
LYKYILQGGKTEMKKSIDLASMIDVSILKPDVTTKELENACLQAIKYNFIAVAVNSADVAACKNYLKGSSVGIVSSVAFPLGATTLETKLYEAEKAIELGATEIDYVINISKLKDGDYKFIEKEMENLTRLCHLNNVKCKT